MSRLTEVYPKGRLVVREVGLRDGIQMAEVFPNTEQKKRWIDLEYAAGARIFDASLAGLGGCPFAPGATGNVVIEDLLFMFERMGYDTGVDVAKLVQARAVIEESMPGEPLYGGIARAGLPKNFR